MDTSTSTKQPAKPGDTFIAYIHDSASCIGVITEEDDSEYTALVLGWFTHKPTNDVFGKPFQHQFPSYEKLGKWRAMPYSFELEFAFCRARNRAWWKSVGGPCDWNLIQTHFWPRQIKELEYICAARHILDGGDAGNFVPLEYLDEEIFLRLWATLYCHFPKQVQQPPHEWDSKNSNIYYTIDTGNATKPPVVTSGTRSLDYVRKS